jgi:hypothetical protein
VLLSILVLPNFDLTSLLGSGTRSVGDATCSFMCTNVCMYLCVRAHERERERGRDRVCMYDFQ